MTGVRTVSPRRWIRRSALVATAAGVVLAATATPAVAATNGFNPDPTRIVDTRIDMPDRPAGPAEGFLQATLPDSVPDGATALLSVTIVTPTTAGYITAYADGSDVPATSDVTFVPGNTVARAVLVPAASGASGKIDFAIDPNAGPITLVVDVIGSFAQGSYTSLAMAERAYDSRTGDGAGLRGPGVYTVTLPTGEGGVPDDAQAVAVTLTQAGATGTGYVSALSSADASGTSSVNYDAGTVNSNLVFVKPVGGKIYLRVVGAATNLIVDVKGYTLTQAVSAQAPVRTFDSRQSVGGGLLGVGTVAIPLPSSAPAGASFAILNVTSTEATSAGYLASYQAAAGQMQTSNLNWVPGPNVAGLVLAPVVDGKAQLYIGAGSTKLVADVEGYVVNSD